VPLPTRQLVKYEPLTSGLSISSSTQQKRSDSGGIVFLKIWGKMPLTLLRLVIKCEEKSGLLNSVNSSLQELKFEISSRLSPIIIVAEFSRERRIEKTFTFDSSNLISEHTQFKDDHFSHQFYIELLYRTNNNEHENITFDEINFYEEEMIRINLKQSIEMIDKIHKRRLQQPFTVKIDDLEKRLREEISAKNEKQQTIAALTAQNNELQKKINALNGVHLSHLSLEEIEQVEIGLRDAIMRVKTAHQQRLRDIKDETMCKICNAQKKNVLFFNMCTYVLL